jgi:hypothetical protein
VRNNVIAIDELRLQARKQIKSELQKSLEHEDEILRTRNRLNRMLGRLNYLIGREQVRSLLSELCREYAQHE